jgi:hypothetical protein
MLELLMTGWLVGTLCFAAGWTMRSRLWPAESRLRTRGRVRHSGAAR